MTEMQNSKQYNLEPRTLEFARLIRLFVKKLPKTAANIEDGKQVIRSSGSVGANYMEANESLSKKDLIMRIKISRKEAKETMYWLNLLDTCNLPLLEQDRQNLIQEARELMNIFGSIIIKLEKTSKDKDQTGNLKN